MWNAAASASWLALHEQDTRLSAPLAESQASAGGIRQGAASRQMLNSAKCRRNRCLSPQHYE